MRIRVASREDIPVLVRMGAIFIKESPTFKQRGFDPDKAARHFKWLLDGNGIIFLAIQDGQIIGGFVGGIATDWHSDQKLAFDYVLYVKPEYRKTTAAYALVKSFIDWAKSNGADRIQCGTTTGVESAACINLYKKFGFKCVGALLDLELNNV